MDSVLQLASACKLKHCSACRKQLDNCTEQRKLYSNSSKLVLLVLLDRYVYTLKVVSQVKKSHACFPKTVSSAGGLEPSKWMLGASPTCYMVREDRNYTSIVGVFMMCNSRSGSLANKIGCRNSLTPRDLKNHHFGLLSVNYTGAVKYF